MSDMGSSSDNTSIKTDTEGDSSLSGCCAKSFKSFFSTVGLYVLNIVFIILGAWIFSSLETTNEQEACYTKQSNYDDLENATLKLMLRVTDKISNGILQQKSGQALIRNDYAVILQKFSKSVLAVQHDVSKNCSTMGQPGGAPYEWSFENSAVFAMTVTTTIGYGVIAPKTFWGRIVFILYALIGIPMMLLCLANFGEIMAMIFRYIYATVCCCGCCIKKPKKPAAQRGRRSRTNSWTGSDDSDSDDDDDDESENSDEEVTVPLTISLISLLTFLAFGAALFDNFEKDWGFVDAFYYCFTTYSTIGFGDLVPGFKNLEDPAAQAKLITAGLFQVIGMAWVSMCFQLMQDEMVAKIKWIGEKIGLSKSKKSNKGAIEDGQNHVDEDEEDEEDNSRKFKGRFGIQKIKPMKKSSK